MPPRLASHAVLLVTLAGCVGDIQTPTTRGLTPTVPGAPSSGPTCEGVRPGRAPLRRLTRVEYDNSVEALLGDTRRLASGFVAEEQLLGFENNADALTVSPLLAEQLMGAAEALAAAADLTRLLPCDPSRVGEGECARQLIEHLGLRSYRRPVAADEAARLYGLYTWARAEGQSFDTAVRLVLEAMLQSPYFVYRVELDGVLQGGAVAVGPYGLASRLSFFLWHAAPDAELLEAARLGQLAEPAQLEAQARRMLADPRAHDMVERFHHQWLQLDAFDRTEKDSTLFPRFGTAKASMKEETRLFLEDAFWRDGRAGQLFAADSTFVDAELARLYGVPAPAGGFAKVSLGGTRAGLLTQASLLSALARPDRTSPIHRGKFVREQVLCQQLAAPPDDVPPPAPLSATKTQREQLAQHATEPSCAACHDLMDPIGLGFEGYDAVGAVRALENGAPVDTRGEVLAAAELNGPFSSAVELGHRLETSRTAMRCLSTQWFRYAHGRADAPADACSIDRALDRLTASGFQLPELLVALTQTDAFRYRELP